MPPILTILVPNYNRPKSLYRLLKTIFQSIDAATASDDVRVLVVDDYSTVNIHDSINEFLKRPNFIFKVQSKKRGNAEYAFLSATEYIGTEYTWLLGNDDYVSQDSLKIILPLLKLRKYGFVLLNPKINKPITGQFISPILTTSPSVSYDSCHDLFMDFGFVTSTTTFPCILFRTAPVREFHDRNNLCQHATVYSHTFTLYAALRHEPALFMSDQIVGFTLNERLEEQAKLEKQAPNGIAFYHQSLGLCRLIAATSEHLAISPSVLMSALEDEVNKDAMTVHPTSLSHFAAFFFIEQLTREQHSLHTNNFKFRGFETDEIMFILNVLSHSSREYVTMVANDAVSVYFSMRLDPVWKDNYYRRLQARIIEDARKYYASESISRAEGSARKVFPSTFEVYGLRGKAAHHSGEALFAAGPLVGLNQTVLLERQQQQALLP